MGGDFDGSAGGSGGRFPGAFMSAGTSSFADFLGSYAPGLLPGNVPLPSGPGTHPWPPASESSLIRDLPHATTIVAAVCREGVVMAGDRRATSGNMIAQRDIEKVLRCDEYSCVGFSGVAGLATEMVRLFQVELEHYEKLEGRTLSLEGKANRLATMIRANLGGAMQGLVVVPLFAGFDEDAKRGRIFSYDVVGGRYEEHLYQGLGRRHAPAGRRARLHARPLRRGRRGLGDRRPGRDQEHLPGDRHDHRRRLRPTVRW